MSALRQHFKVSSGAKDLTSHHLYHGKLLDQRGSVIDEVLAVYMAAPRSYTCEDVVEIHCHGSQQIVKEVLRLFQVDGLRLAEPGEFTYRAFMNGRLDLSQAEAVARLIHSHSESSRKIALSHLEGALSTLIGTYSNKLKKSLVLLEAWIDFPEEDLPEEDLQEIYTICKSIFVDSSEILKSYKYGKVLVEGVSIVLAGQPNVGKSSLLNVLLGEERAIVTDIPGTTRDLIEEGMSINGLSVKLIDTAGLRVSDDLVEVEGIKRAEKKLETADLVLLLLDSTKDMDERDFRALNLCQGLPTFLVFTKNDLPHDSSNIEGFNFPVFRISSKSESGIDELKTAISEYFINQGGMLENRETVILSEQRHFDALFKCTKNLENVLASIGSTDLELLAFELREALYFLGQISGETSTEDLLDEIFSNFCIGK